MKPWIKILLEIFGTLLWYILLIWGVLIVMENEDRNATIAAVCAVIFLVAAGFLYIFYDSMGRFPKWFDLQKFWLYITEKMSRPGNIAAIIIVVSIVVLSVALCPDKQKHIEAHMDNVKTTDVLDFFAKETQLKGDMSIRNNLLFSVAKSKRFGRVMSVGIFGRVVILTEYVWMDEGLHEE